MAKILSKTLKKEIEKRLEIYSIDELLTDCRTILKQLRKYPEANRFQIKYYSKFWNLLSEY